MKTIEQIISETPSATDAEILAAAEASHISGTDRLLSPGYARSILSVLGSRADGIAVWTDTHASPETATTALSMASEFATSDE